MDDVLAIAGQLDPGRPHSAYFVRRVPTLRGEEAFEFFLSRMIRRTVTTRFAPGGYPARLVVIEGADGTAWHWGSMLPTRRSRFVERVRRDARPIPEPWLFAIELLRPEPFIGWPEASNASACGPARQDWGWTAVWYVEARGRGMAISQGAVLDLEFLPEEDGERALSETAVPVAEHPVTRDFHRILHGHPSRKRHPLRRRRPGSRSQLSL